MRHQKLTLLLALAATGCAVVGPPVFPDSNSAPLVGPRCDRTGHPCRCSISNTPVGEPAEGRRRFEIRLPRTIGTRSAVEIEGIGAVVRDEDDPQGSCFYLDLEPGATYRVRYLAEAHSRDRGISVAFLMRELGLGGEGWYDVIQQRCGNSDTPCQYGNVDDWTRSVEGGHRFHDPCGSSRLTGIRVDGGLYDRRFSDAQFSFNLTLRHHPPTAAPRSSCRETMAEPDPGPSSPADE